jgi:hypothetical protein
LPLIDTFFLIKIMSAVANLMPYEKEVAGFKGIVA